MSADDVGALEQADPAEQLKILVDTNVWLDFFLGYRPGNAAAKGFVAAAKAVGAQLLYSSSCLQDVFALVAMSLKRAAREEGAVLERDAWAIRKAAWACVDAMRELAAAVGTDESDLWLACKYRTLAWDLEDNVVLAATQRAGADYLVTSDKALIEKANVAAMTPPTMIELLKM